MADALELADDDFAVDLNAPPGFRSADGRTSLFIVVFVAAFFLLIIQFIVPQLVAVSMMPRGTPSLFNFQIESAQPGQAVWWDGRLWVSVMTMTPGTAGGTVLRALKDDGSWDRDSDFKLAVPFEYALVQDGQLWLVSSTSVTTIQPDRQTRTVYPRLALNQSSRPFLHNGRLCVLDRPVGQNDVAWYEFREGEWTARGRIAMSAGYQAALAAQPSGVARTRTRITGPFPTTVVVASGTTSAPLAVVLPDGRVWVGTTVEVNGTPRLWSTIIANVDLLDGTTQNDGPADALVLDDPAACLIWTEHTGSLADTYGATVLDGEPVVINLATTAVPAINSNLRVQVLKLSNGELVMIHELPAFPLEQATPIAKPDGTLVFLATSRLSPLGLNVVELTSQGFGPIRRVGDSTGMDTSQPNYWLLYGMSYCIPLLTGTILALIAHVMVERHRDRRFNFGHHTVKLASIARRGMARMIDMQLFGLPFLVLGIGMMSADVMGMVEQQINAGAFATLMFWALVLVLGFLLYVILAALFFGTLEGVWGASPGKWLMGIRVVRTTFRPIGILRGLIRQFLLVIDGLFNYFVAILMAACLSKSQRLGDLCADSIVVENRSLPPNWRNPAAESQG